MNSAATRRRSGWRSHGSAQPGAAGGSRSKKYYRLDKERLDHADGTALGAVRRPLDKSTGNGFKLRRGLQGSPRRQFGNTVTIFFLCFRVPRNAAASTQDCIRRSSLYLLAARRPEAFDTAAGLSALTDRFNIVLRSLSSQTWTAPESGPVNWPFSAAQLFPTISACGSR